MMSSIKRIILPVSVMVLLIASVLGQTLPVLGQSTSYGGSSAFNNYADLTKRDYAYGGNQHLTVRTGVSNVCGDHICAPGEWTALQQGLATSQLGHIPEKNVTRMYSYMAMTNSTSSTTTLTSPTTNSTMSTPAVQPSPTPIPTPPPMPYSVCNTVKTVLSNSTISPYALAKIMTDLGCNQG